MLGEVARFGFHFLLAAALLHGATICTLPGPTVGADDHGLALAIEVLRASDAFYASRVGDVGFTPPEVLAWRVVARSSDADKVFQSLLATGARPARLYALAWLQHARPNVYGRMAGRERAKGGSVRTMAGCIMWERPIADLLDEMDRGEWTRDLSVGPRGMQPTLIER